MDLKQIQERQKAIEAEYALGIDCKDILPSVIGRGPSKTSGRILRASCLESPLGPLLAIADDLSLFFLEFIDLKSLERDIEKLGERAKAVILEGESPPIDSIKKELELYFAGQLRQFKTPLFLVGSPFQKRVWMTLKTVPYGETRSYAEIAAMTGNPSAYRAVARANATNHLTLVLPCHRIINANGNLGGYGRGVSRKEWLIHHEMIA